MPKNFWMGFKGRKGKEQTYSLAPDTYHRVKARSKEEAMGIFLKGTRFTVGEVVVRRRPPRSPNWDIGKNFASKKSRRR